VELVINRQARDALYGTLLQEIASIGDIWIHLTTGQPAQAERMRSHHEQNMRLLDDLKWAEDTNGQQFPITMPIQSLRQTLERLYWISAATLSHTAELQQQAIRQTTHTQQTCSELLAQLTDSPRCSSQAGSCSTHGTSTDLIEQPSAPDLSDLA
jgi:hypothetical protein